MVLTSFDDDEAVAAALDAGAAAFVLKTVRGTEIADIVRAVASGRNLLDERALARRKASHVRPDRRADAHRDARCSSSSVTACPTARSATSSGWPRRP